MAKYTVIYGTNVLIKDNDKKSISGLKPITFFADHEAKNKETAEWEVGNKITTNDFIQDNGGYWRRTSVIVSFKVEERLEVTNNIMLGGKEK